MNPGHPELLALISDEIATHGPMTVARFMDLALYHPDWGYYMGQGTYDVRPRIGFAGDFYTSSDVHPVVGWALAGQLDQIDRLLTSPESITVVEVGAGKGLLARDILSACETRFPSLFRRLRYVLIDRSPAHRAMQRETLAPWLDRTAPAAQIIWHDDLSDLPQNSVTGLVLSNELVDAFPVHRVQMLNGTLVEHRIGLTDDRLTVETGALSTPALAEYFHRIGVTLADGAIADVNLQAADWIQTVASVLRQGFVITIDYGHSAKDLYGSERRQGTLRSYSKHRVSDNLLESVGQQDLTSHVDFTNLAAAGRDAGLTVAGFTNQMSFLMGLGIEAYCATLPDDSPELLSIGHLLRPHGMGTTFKVLVHSKGMPHATLDGLRLTPFFEDSLDPAPQPTTN
ncbi:MAG: SAM-dependent methyltransferase [Nitrospiraceae bacterium]